MNFLYAWIGNVENSNFYEVIEQIFEGEWDEDGDGPDSPFEEAFGLDFFDNDYLGYDRLPESTNSLDKLLDGVPYAEELIQSIKEQGLYEHNREYNASVTWFHNERIEIKSRTAHIGEDDFMFLTVIELDK